MRKWVKSAVVVLTLICLLTSTEYSNWANAGQQQFTIVKAGSEGEENSENVEILVEEGQLESSTVEGSSEGPTLEGATVEESSEGPTLEGATVEESSEEPTLEGATVEESSEEPALEDSTVEESSEEQSGVVPPSNGITGEGTSGTAHHYDAGKVTVDAGCTTEGVITYTCQDADCDDTKTEVIPAKGHTFVEGKCEVCDAVDETFAALVAEHDHYFIDGVCTFDGCKEAPEDHEWIEDIDKRIESTCKEAGMAYYHCTVNDCTAIKEEILPLSTEHKYVNGICTICGGNLQGVTYSSDLRDFLDRLQITGDGLSWDSNSNTPCNLSPSKTYSFSLNFSEKFSTSKKIQFEDGAALTYQLPAGMIIKDGGASGELSDGSKVRGTYTISKDGLITIHFEEGYTADYTNVDAYINFNASLSEEFITISKEEEIYFSDDIFIKGEVIIAEQGALNAKKEIVSLDKDTLVASYKITMNVTGTCKNVRLVDTMESNLTLVDGSLSVTPSDEVTVTMNSARQFTISADSITAEKNTTKSIVITYQAKIDENAFKKLGASGKISSLRNTIKYQCDGQGELSQTVDLTAKYDGELKYNWIKKSNSVNGNIATWKLKVNETARFNISGAVVTDTLPTKNLTYLESEPITVTVRDRAGKQIRVDTITWGSIISADKRSWTYVIPQENGAYSYEFLYKTEIDIDTSATGNQGFRNNGKIEWEGNGHSIGSNGSIGPVIQFGILKEAVPGENLTTLNWKITLSVPKEGLKKAFVKDVDGEVWQSGKALYNSFKDGSMKVSNTAGHDIQVKVFDDSQGYIICFGGDDVTASNYSTASSLPAHTEDYTITLEYTSDINPEIAPWTTVHNRASFWANGTVKESGAGQTIKGKDLDISKSIVRANTMTGVVEYQVVINRKCLTGLYKGISVTDTFSDNMEFVQGSASVRKGYETWIPEDDVKNPSWKLSDANCVVSGNSVTFNIGDVSDTISHWSETKTGCALYLTYQMKVKDEILATSDKISVTNKADLYSNGNYLTSSGNVNYSWSQKILTKRETVVPSATNKYTGSYLIDIESPKLSLLTNNDGKLVVTDEMTNLILDVDSIAIVDIGSGGKILTASEYNISYENGKLVITLLKVASNHYQITYKASLVAAAVGSTVHYSNKAFIEGFASVTTEEIKKSIVITQDTSGGTSASDCTVKVVKYGEGNINNRLAGARFALYEGTYESGTEIMTATTNARGEATFKPTVNQNGTAYIYGELYTIVEVSAPNGYVKTDRQWQFTIPDPKSGAAASGATPVGDGHMEYFNNDKAGFTVLKVNEKTNQGLSGAVFKLFKDAECINEVHAVTAAAAGDGKYTFTDLKEGTYYLKETQAPASYYIADGIFEVKVSPSGISVKQIAGETVNISYNSDNLTLTFPNKQKQGELSVKKVDEALYNAGSENAGLAGVSLQLYSSKTVNGVAVPDKAVGGVQTTSAENGYTVTFTGLTVGEDYFVVETQAASGYATPGIQNPFGPYRIAESSQTLALNEVITNKKVEGSVVVLKVREGGIALPGASFTLYKDGAVYTDAPGSNQGVYVTDGGGLISINNLPVGEYKIVETTAPEGFMMGTEAERTKTFTVSDAEGAVNDYDFSSLDEAIVNTQKLGSLSLTKVDKDDNTKLLNGAEFALYVKVNGSESRYPNDNTTYTTGNVYTLSSTGVTAVAGSEGVLSVNGLPFGTYYFKELQAPAGYKAPAANNKTQDVTIGESSYSATVSVGTVENEGLTGGVLLTKVDMSNQPLSGAEFELYAVKADGTESKLSVYEGSAAGTYTYTGRGAAVEKLITPVNGIIRVTGLPFGSYYFKEVTAPSGYDLPEGNAAQTPFVVDKELTDESVAAQWSGVTVTNSKNSAAVRFQKINPTGTGLNGAVFELFQMVNGTAVSKGLVTSAAMNGVDGIVYKEGLAIGDYYFVETQAPAGYSIVANNGEALRYTFSITAQDANSATGVVTLDASNANVTMKDAIAQVSNTEQDGSLILTKSDNHGKGLNGAVFTLSKKAADGQYQPYGANAGRYTTAAVNGVDGTILIENLPWGEYRLEETQAPEGYDLFKDADGKNWSQDFTVNATSQSFNYSVVNNEKSGSLVLEKLDRGDNSRLMNGVTFILEGITDTQYTQTQVTAEDSVTKTAKATFSNIPWGTYRLVEIIPVGYDATGADANRRKVVKDQIVVGADGQGNIHLDIDFTRNGEGAIYNTQIKGSLQLEKYDNMAQPLGGVQFALYAVTKDSSGNDVEAPNPAYTGSTAADGTMTISNIAWGTYRLYENTVPTGYEDAGARKLIDEFAINATHTLHSLTGNAKIINNRATGSVELEKVDGDDNNQPMSGVSFTLYKADGSLYEAADSLDAGAVKSTFVTNDEGKIYVTGLEWGDYYFLETTPAGYANVDAVKKEFSISQGALHAAFVGTNQVVNTHLDGSITLTKTDETSQAPIDGAEFALYKVVLAGGETLQNNNRDNDTLYRTEPYVTSNQGVVSQDKLDFGTYYFKETKAAAEYELPVGDAAYSPYLTIDAAHANPAGTMIEDAATMTNKKIEGYVRLTKLFDQTDNLTPADIQNLYSSVRLMLVKYTDVIKNEYTKVADNLQLDANGQLVYGPLEIGTYAFMETQTADEYIIAPNNKTTFTITESTLPNDPVDAQAGLRGPIDVELTNTKVIVDVGFVKVDTDNNNEVIAGARFALYKNGAATPMTTVVSDANGRVYYNGLGVGEYYFQEVHNEGYVVDDTRYYFTVDKDSVGSVRIHKDSVNGEVVETVGNERLTGSFSLRKVEEGNTGNVLAGAEFSLYRDGESQPVAIGLTTGSDGILTYGTDSGTGLTWGSYYIVETKAPAGYALDTTRRTFVIDRNNVSQTIQIGDITNRKILGSVTLRKADDTSGAALQGAEFTLHKTDGGNDTVYGIYTTADGTVNGVERGTITVRDLPEGDYYFVETKAPAGYVLDSSLHYVFSITQDNMSSVINLGTINNKRQDASVTLTKRNSNNGNALAGAEFRLYTRTPQNIAQQIVSLYNGNMYYAYGTYTTDSNGQLTVTGLPWGTYYFVETKAPDGYSIQKDSNGNDIAYTFVVDGTSEARLHVNLGNIGNTPNDDDDDGGGGGGGGGSTVTYTFNTGTPVEGGEVLGARVEPTGGIPELGEVLGDRVSPKTGDATNMAAWIITLLLALMVVVFAGRKLLKERKRKTTV